MAVYLMRHGSCLSTGIDPRRPLSDEGIREVEAVARTVSMFDIAPSGIRHSGKLRARQTAEIMASCFGVDISIGEMDGLLPEDDAVVFAESLRGDENTLFVGHLPFMERVVSYAITRDPAMPVVRFQTASCVCLENDVQNSRWVVRWAVMPPL